MVLEVPLLVCTLWFELVTPSHSRFVSGFDICLILISWLPSQHGQPRLRWILCLKYRVAPRAFHDNRQCIQVRRQVATVPCHSCAPPGSSFETQRTRVFGVRWLLVKNLLGSILLLRVLSLSLSLSPSISLSLYLLTYRLCTLHIRL